MLSSTSADYVTERALDDLWIICNACQVVPATHQSPVLTWTTVNICGKNLHHVFFGIGWLGWRTAVAVGRHIDGFLRVEEAHDIAWQGSVDDRGRDQLVHCLVIRRVGRIVHKAGTTCVNAAREEGHAK